MLKYIYDIWIEIKKNGGPIFKNIKGITKYRHPFHFIATPILMKR